MSTVYTLQCVTSACRVYTQRPARIQALVFVHVQNSVRDFCFELTARSRKTKINMLSDERVILSYGKVNRQGNEEQTNNQKSLSKFYSSSHRETVAVYNQLSDVLLRVLKSELNNCVNA